MDNIVTIGRETTFELKEGRYRARLVNIIPSVKNNAKGLQQWRRFVWEVQVPGLRYKKAMAGRNFLLSLEPGSDLRSFLQTWLGKEYFELEGRETVDLDDLLGMDCELELVHFTGKGFSTPMTMVATAHRVGTLDLTEEDEVVTVDESEND